ncbi:MAG: hypothetical protein V4563_15990, partial [Pseudomonadota bacterium]
TELRDNQVIIQFAKNIPPEAQGAAMMQMERGLRLTTGLPIEVFKEAMADDSKLRAKMTPEQREKL